MGSKFRETNRFILDEFLDTFGREFCKHEVLWKPAPNCKEFEIQSATHAAYSSLAQALHLSVEAILELLKTFPVACQDLISRYELRRKIDVRCRMPDWLTLLAGQSTFFKNSRKYMKPAVYARNDLMRALCESARIGLRAGVTDDETEDEASLLRGPQAVAYFVSRHGVTEEEVLPAWHSALELSVVKLRAVLATGDRLARLPRAMRPAADERALADLVLLHDDQVSQITFLTPGQLRTLVLLFQLIVAAKETYDGGGTDACSGANDNDNILYRIDRLGGEETRAPTTGDSDGAPETADSSSIIDDTSGLTRLDSAIQECVEPRSARNLLHEIIVEFVPRRRSNDVDDAPAEHSLDDEQRKELEQESDILVISSDTSDCEISDIYIEECSKENTEVPVALDEGRNEETGSDIMEKSNLGYGERASYISAGSQNSDTRSEYPTKYRYEGSESNSSEERKVVWALVYTDFIKRGRSASLISLQHRWVELCHLSREALLAAWRSDALVDRSVHPLLLVVAHRFPEIVTENLPSWKSLVLERQIIVESDIKDIINKYHQQDNVLLNISENLTFPDLLKKYVGNENVIDPRVQSKNNATTIYKHLSYQIHKDNHSNIINNADKVIEQESQAQDNAINNELNVNKCISTMLDQIDPSKAKISIIIEEDSDEDGDGTNCDNSFCHGTTPYLNNLNVPERERRTTYLREENNHISLGLEKHKTLIENTLKSIEKKLEDKLNYMNGTVDLFVENNSSKFNENINDNNELLTDKQTVSHDFGSPEKSSLLPSYKPVIDEKLVKLARVVITPIEHLPEWKKHSRNGVIKCRNFSVKNFTKPVIATSIQLSRCASNVNTNKNHSDKYERKNNEVRIKFEDDINNGIKYQKYIELYNMPDHSRSNRIKLTRTLKLSRTYFSLDFWSLDSNIELMKHCKPMSIQLSRGVPRVAKRVELSDINEVRKINRSILTAQVSPTVGTVGTVGTPASYQVQRSSTSREAANSDTTRQTNNSLSSALDSKELLNLLTNYVTQMKKPKKNSESVTKDITSNSNLMDSIIDTLRLADKNNSQHSTVACTLNSLQQSCLPSSNTLEMLESCNTNITNNISGTFNTIQKSTEEVNNIHNISINPKQTVNPNVGDLKDMILVLVKHSDTKMKHEYSMKLNQTSLNLHLKNFEKQISGLVRNLSKLSKILPQYFLNMKPKRSINVTVQNQQTNINRIKWKQSKEHSTLPSSNLENSTDTTNNTNSIYVDDDCEPNLVIDERSLELSDNIYLSNSQCNKIYTNKDVQEKCNIRKNDMKEKHIKKTKKKSRHSKKIPEKEKPILNEYQEWHRQKTMALKYFTLPMIDTSKLTLKDKIAQQQSAKTTTNQLNNGCQTNLAINKKNTKDLASKSTEQKSNGSQTTIPINRKNTVDLATTSTEQKSNGSQTTIPINRTNTKDLATTSTEQQSNGSQTTIPIKRKNTEDLATTSTEQQSNGRQTTIPIKRKNTEDLATTSTEHQNNGSQTTIPIKRKNTEDLATTSTEQQSNGRQTTIPTKRKNTEDLATTSTEQQSNGSQTTIPIKRKNIEDLATTSTASDITKRPKFLPNESNVVYISDCSSDDDVQITNCNIAQDTNDNHPNTTQSNIHDIDKIENGNQFLFINDILQREAANQNVRVVGAPVAVSTQPIYLIIDDTQLPTATENAINKTQDSEIINNPVVFQVLSNETPFPTLTQVAPQNKTLQTQILITNEKCAFTNKCECTKCENTLRDDILTCSLDLIQNGTSGDSRNNEPSTSVPKKSKYNDHLMKEAISVKEYLSANQKLTALIKVDGSRKLVFFCKKYIILTDVNIPNRQATYRTSIKINNKKKLARVLVPSESNGNVLLLGLKKESDYIYCKCQKGKRLKCDLCQCIEDNLPNHTNLLKIDCYYYRKYCQKPNKYVRLSENELVINSRAVLEGNPDLILINKMFFKKLTDSPPTYVRILSAPQDAATLRHLVRREVSLYAFDVTLAENCITSLVYAQTAGHITVDHSDSKLVKVLQWILN